MNVSPRTILEAAKYEYRRGRMEHPSKQDDPGNPEFKEWIRTKAPWQSIERSIA